MTVLVTLIVYKIVLVAIGLLAQKKTRDGVDFFLGGRQLGPLVAAISASASSSSAWTLMAVSGTAYTHGLSALWIFPSCVGGFLINWCVVAPRLRRMEHVREAVTLTDVLAGPWKQPYRRQVVGLAAAITVFSFTIYVASQFNAAGKTFSETFELDPTVSILIGSAVVLAYTLLGGFWAVSITDTLQGLLMAATAVILPVTALIEVGGFSELWQGIQAVGGNFGDVFRGYPGLAAVAFVLGIFGIGIGYPGQPHVVNRFLALESGERQLRHAQWIAIGWAVLVFAGMLLLGLCGRVLFESMADSEAIFIKATHALFPEVVAGIMVAAVLSAIMSTADSQLLVAASSVTHDLGLGGTARDMLVRSRWVVLAIGGVAVLLSLDMLRETTIYSSVLAAWFFLGSAFGPVLLVTVLHGPIPARRTFLSMSVGFTLSVILPHVVAPTPENMVGRVVPFLVALSIALWTGPRSTSGGSTDSMAGSP